MGKEIEAYGNLLNSMNLYEYQLNIALEITFEYVQKSAIEPLKSEMIDFFHELSFNKRIGLLGFSLTCLNNENFNLNSEIKKLSEIKLLFNKDLQSARNMIAHNPMFDFNGEYRVISSRRFLGKSTHLSLGQVEKYIDQMIPINIKLNGFCSSIQSKFEIYPIRDLPNKKGPKTL
tara:strand:+ start:90 stop:614 length:525 start_codon:yes stop_codon:yes gene_type:complete